MTFKRNAFAAAVSVSALASGHATAAVSPGPCPRMGATYAAHPAASTPGLAYRLHVGAVPRSDADAATAELWRFQVSDARGRKLVELRMHYGCSNGAGPCSVSPPGRPGVAGGYASEVVQLARDFTPASGDRAPYALVLPGFAQDDWSFPRSEQSMPDLTFFTPEHVLPDLRERQVWLLTGCGGGKRAP